ncbi:conserved Plasmodium protein, unknown function [Plasmodium chabaudi chabaudi]|uniref:Uncharacterized protein n=1 Tax=Plasmodium chabaudi chabaudi TaxID=31271 RepID=A0A1C6X155_PLACU|nr:conserved Plasmodium protein, unknown function [Plasmodium chabaudi chabaudi]
MMVIFSILFVFVAFLNISCDKMYDIKHLSQTEQKLALNLIQIYESTKSAEEEFYKKFENWKQIYSEIQPKDNKENDENKKENIFNTNTILDSKSEKKQNDINKSQMLQPSFVQIKSKGPVEEETIWRALYDTQLKRSPATESIHVFSLENIKNEYEEAKLSAFVSQIDMMRNNFEKNLHYMNEELPRKKRLMDIIKTANSLEADLSKLYKKNTHKYVVPKKVYEGTKVSC